MKVAPPNLAVIDRAIALVEIGRNAFTCYALQCAVHDVEGRPWISERSTLYCRQWREFNCHRNGGRFPKWWNKAYSPRRKASRVAALRAFKQACIEAAK